MYLFIKLLRRYFIKIPLFVKTQTIPKDPNFKSCRLLFLFDRKTFGFTLNTEQKRWEGKKKTGFVCATWEISGSLWKCPLFLSAVSKCNMHRARIFLDMDAMLNFDRFNLERT